MMFQGFLPSLYAEEDEDDHSTSDSSFVDPDNTNNEPLCLEGFLYCRMGRGGSFSWKRRFVVLSMQHDGASLHEMHGSLAVYKLADDDVDAFSESAASTVLRSVYSKPARMAKSIQRKLSSSGTLSGHSERRELDVSFGANVAWVAKDVLNDSSTFMVEILTTEENEQADDDESDVSSLDSQYDSTTITERQSLESQNAEDRNSSFSPPTMAPAAGETEQTKPLRVYFRCQKGKGSNEKALWLRAFDRLNRLSPEMYQTSLIGSLTHKLTYYRRSRKRIRSKSNALFARHVRQLELDDDDEVSHTENGVLSKNSVLSPTSIEDVRFVHNDVERMVHGASAHASANKEYRVYPRYAYPHRWMTRQEMMEEMSLTSDTFHDLRVPGCEQNEIGCLKVEVLQCLGLPKLDRTSDTDGIVYLVCGSYAFATDVIPNNPNPMWLRKAKRACEIPLFHAFARLYVGVFDDDANRTKDEFAGRVVLDLARLRPCSTYDVTLPLRLSSHVYSRRRRGAIRLRLSLRWHTEREALMSYIPNKIHIPLPQNSQPKTDVTVCCSDPKAFRNIAITVHGAHLPGKFTFHQMRSAIREINYTRKYIFTMIRLGIRETRHWHNPAVSGFVFFAWMHCVYANTFALVPAYIMSYFVLMLTKNYVKYGIDGANNRGFIPPSWEELLLALIRGGDREYHAIEPLELGLRATSFSQLRAIDESGPAAMDRVSSEPINDQSLPIDYKVKTHVPKGKFVFRWLGLLSDSDDAFVSAEECHLEFPFADGDIAKYPKFTVKEALVGRNGEELEDRQMELSAAPDGSTDRFLATNGKGEIRLVPRRPKRLEMEMPDIMRKDSSGMNDHDEEEYRFNPRRAVLATGKQVILSVSKPTKRTVKDMKKTAKTATGAATTMAGAGFSIAMNAATTVAKTAGEIGEMTGLSHVVAPVTSTLQSGYQGVSTHVIAPVTRSSQKFMRGNLSSEGGEEALGELQARIAAEVAAAAQARSTADTDEADMAPGPCQSEPASSLLPFSFGRWNLGQRALSGTEISAVETMHLNPSASNIINHAAEDDDQGRVFKWPEQNVDIDGPSTGRKLTDDLQDIKDKVHDMTWHLFDDKIYVIKNPDALFFGQAKKPERRRTTRSVDKDLDKLMKVNQYSHNNPFVARMGQYVEPIIGSANSFLCLFRALFNVMAWRDPMLTFWVSFLSGILALVLFVFPWRLFLFVLGCFLVGPHLWGIRVLRDWGYLPPAKRKKRRRRDSEQIETGVPSQQPVFTRRDRETGSLDDEAVTADPREIHRVVVPYSPLIYNRFYDWPPEPQYAQVKRDAVYDSTVRRSAVLQSRMPRNLLRARAASTDGRSRFRAWARARTNSWEDALMPSLPESPDDPSSLDEAVDGGTQRIPDGVRRRRSQSN